MAAEYDNGYFEKRIGHCNIHWKIENYCLTTCKDNCNIFSPEFYARGIQTTKWVLILNPKCRVEKNAFRIAVYLKRLESNPGPDTVWGNWILKLLYKQDELFCSAKFEYNFQKESISEAYLVNTDTIVDKMLPFEQDTLDIQCQLIVNYEHLSKKLECSNIGQELLSQNLENLYKNGKYHDIFIKTKDKTIRAHKAVLYARNRMFAKLIDEAEDKDTIILEQDYDAVENVIEYLYSGKVEYFLSKPSISLYTCIKYLKIEELMFYYIPEELMLHTSVDVEEFVFVWLITDFRQRNENCITSPVLKKGISETCWRLHLYPKGVEDYVEHISIFAEIVESRKQMYVYIEFAVIDDNKYHLCSRRLCKSTEGNEMFGFNDFIQNDFLKNSSLLSENTLKTVFKLRISKGEKLLSTGIHTMSVVYKKEEHYHSLSMDILRMFELATFRDIVLIADEKHFMAHKCILATRSHKFARIFDNMSLDQKSLTFPNIAPNILVVVLHYIYSGVLRAFEECDLVQLYEAAHFFENSQLKNDCSKLLQSQIDLENVCKLLILAENNKDQDLKISALNYISLNSEEVFQQQSWQNLTVDKPFYSTEVLNYVKYNQDDLMSSAELQMTSRSILNEF